jgi:hypothetical protein
MVIIRKDFLKLDSREVFGMKKVPNSQIERKSREFFSFLQDFLDKEKIDIVNAQGFDVSTPAAFKIALHMACFSANVPCVMQAHSFPEKEIDKAFIKSLPWKKIICVSQSVAGDLFSKGIDIDKLSTIYLGVNTDEFNSKVDRSWLKKTLKISNNEKALLHASRITDGEKPILKSKGIIILLEAFAKLSDSHPDLKLVIATATPPVDIENEFLRALEELKNYIRIYNLEGKVICRAFSLEEMPKVYAGADIFAMASESETFGQVFLEAMACGVPVIGTNVGGVPEIIVDGENGFLIPPNDASTLSQRIEEILEDNGFKERLVSVGLMTVEEKFSSERLFKALFDYLETLKK